MSNHPKIDYVITTVKGTIPHVIDGPVYDLNKPFKIFLDDFLYKNSFYDLQNKLSIDKFIGVEDKTILLSFKNKSSCLISKKGNYKPSREKYNEILDLMKPETNNNILIPADFNNGDLFLNGIKVVEPVDLDDFNNIIKNNTNVIFGTEFINKLTDEAHLLYYNDDQLLCVHLNDASTIKNFENLFNLEYYKYLLTINEMNLYSYICEINYLTFNNFINEFNNKL